MPLYRIKCQNCGHEEDIFRKIEERNALPLCSCNGNFSRIISAPAVQGEIQPYISPGSGKLITSRRERMMDLRETKSILNEPGLDRDIRRNKQYQEEKSFAPVAAGVDEAVKKLVATGQIES